MEQRLGQLLAGRTAVVTGGSKGIGFAVARALRDCGAAVAIWSRGDRARDDAAATIGALSVPCDVADAATVQNALRATVDALGRVDILVANAGRKGEEVVFPEVGRHDWDDMIATNLTGTFHTVQAISRHMIERGGAGKIVVVSSIGARFGMSHGVAYATTKAALLGFTRSAAVALARHDIQVNAVLPGWVDTEMSQTQFANDRAADSLLRRTPARRFGQPDDVAGICVYLTSCLSAFHTGDAIQVDGGFLVGM